MKKLHPATALMVFATLTLTLGAGFLSVGIVARQSADDIRRAFSSGNRSMDAIRRDLGLKPHENVAPGREHAMFSNLADTHEWCVGLARLHVDVTHIFIQIGAFLLMSGSATAVYSWRLRNGKT